MVASLFSFFLMLGSEWVLWILLGASILALAVYFDRWRIVRSQEKVGSVFWREHAAGWLDDGIPAEWRSLAPDLARRFNSVEARLLLALARRKEAETAELERVTSSFLASERLRLDRYLAILGTLGNSAPFIGLFGTVLGIIKAFAELDKATGSNGLSSISGGLAEALVTTAAGLLVAIPSAMAFNFFQRKIKTVMSRASSLAGLVSGEER